jgi:L,D-peptidoglycan transpeptidase YkuD (ErfK/YbiS/YcfS/YnhG family)
MRVKRDIALRRAPGNPREGRLALAHGVRRAALGRSGAKALKREGDGATPIGRFPVRQVLYRADRVTRPRTVFPLRAIRADDGWCEDPVDRHYNRPVKLPPKSTADRLARADRLYDFIIEIDHNTRPRVTGRGSAVFIHVARPGLAPTAGCVALDFNSLRRLLARLGPRTRIVIA